MDLKVGVGATATSPLFRAFAAAIGSRAALVNCGTLPAGDKLWQRCLAGTTLDGSGASAVPPTERPDILIDIAGQAVTDPAPRIWRLVDGRGAPILTPFLWAETFHQPPYYASILLLEETSAGSTILGEAHLSSRQSLKNYLSSIGQTSAALVAAALAPNGASKRPFIAEMRPRAHGIAPLVQLLRGLANRQLARWRDRLLAEDWAIGEGVLPMAALLAATSGRREADASALGTIEWRGADTPERYLADPFFWPGDPTRRFAEDFSYATGLGTLVALDRGHGSGKTLDLGFTCHLSYPFAWIEDGSVLMLPESGASRVCRIFRIAEDGRAEPICTVAEDRAIADPTLFRHGGFYWIAFTDTDLGAHDNLCLLYSTAVTGPWLPHRANPVKRDVRSSRPGGTPFRVDGVLYRPAQDCAASYGAALAINRVDRCDPDGYAEETVLTILPDPSGPYPDGLHTLSVRESDGAFLIDGKRYRLNTAALAKKLASRFRRG